MNRLAERWTRFASEDGLTALANRRAFDRKLTALASSGEKRSSVRAGSVRPRSLQSRSMTRTAMPSATPCSNVSPRFFAVNGVPMTSPPASAVKVHAALLAASVERRRR